MVHRNIGLAVLGAYPLLATVVMVYELAQEGRSIHFEPDIQLTTSAYYEKGPFSLETWACEAPMSIPSLKNYGLGTQCVGERASRCLLILIWVLSLLIFGTLAWDSSKTQYPTVVIKKQPSWDRDDYWN